MSGLCSLIAVDELLRRDLHAEVDHVEAGALEHDVDEVLADVVHVALDGAHHERADRLDAGLGEQRPQHVQRAAHRAAGDQHLRHEEVTALEPRADLLQRRDEGVEEQRLGRHAVVEALLGQARGPPARCRPASRRTAPCRISSGVMRRPPSWVAGRVRSRAVEQRDSSAALGWSMSSSPRASSRWSIRALGPEMPSAAMTSPLRAVTGAATRVEADLELVERDGVPLRPNRRELPGELRRGRRRCGRYAARGARRQRDRAGGVEHLAESGAVRRDVDLDPVAARRGGTSRRSARPARRCSPRATAEVDGLAGRVADPLQHRAGQPDELVERLVAAA